MSRRRDRAKRSEAAATGDEREQGEAARSQREASRGEPAQAGGRPRAPEPADGWAPGPVAPNRRPPTISFLAQAGILIAVFAISSAIAELAGAANLGVTLGVGQICFAIALVIVIVKT